MLKRAALTAIALLITARLALGPFRQGWSEMRTDFPNHYVGAILALDHQPLKQWYDWEFFQRHVDYAGIQRLGTYTPHPPLTMLPLLPLAKLPPQRAKQVWMIFELLCLAASVLLLARLSNIGSLSVFVLALLAYASLANNFLLGHYYIFLLLLLSGAVWCLLRGRDFTAGALFGLIFALKLYAAPFALFFAFRRQWKALIGMAAAIVVLTAGTVAVFGFDAVWYFATNIMARAGNAEITDPYHPAFGSMSVLLHRLFISEAELNPHPWIASPPLYSFFQTLFSAGLIVFCVLVLPRKSEQDARATAFWIILLFALSPFTAFSHYVMLLVPIALLLPGASLRWSAGLIALYVLVQLPERPWNAWLFPRLWFTLALLIYVGWPFFRAIRPRVTMAALASVVAFSFIAALVRTAPHAAGEPIAVRPGALFSSAPAVTPTGIVYESMESNRFGLRTLDREFHFGGDAFHPSVPASGTPIYFELVSDRRSQIATLDPATGKVEIVAEGTEPSVSPDGASLLYISGDNLILQRGGTRLTVATGHISNPAIFPDGKRFAYTMDHRVIRTSDTVIESTNDCFEPSVSPDGESLAFACSETGGTQVWIMNLTSGERQRITTGACNNTWPVWGRNAIIYASDCNRGLTFPALYSVPR